MARVIRFLLVAVFTFIAVVASSRSRERGEEDDGNVFDRKRTKRFSNPESVLVDGLQTLSVEHDCRTVYEEPFLQFCDNMFPVYSRRELSSVLDEAISEESFDLIKLLEKHDKLAGVLTSDHIEELCRSPTQASTAIIEFIFDLPWFSFEDLEMSPLGLIYYCIPTSLDKFKTFWAAFEAEKMLPVANIASIVFKAAMNRNVSFHGFILEHMADADKRNSVLKQAFSYSIRNFQYAEAIFLLQNGVSLSILDTDLKVSAMRMFTCGNYPEFVRLFLSDPDVYARVRVMPNSPWLRAVSMDLPEIVEIYVQAYPSIQERGLVMLAFSKKSHLVLEHFKSKGVLKEDTLFMMALTSIQGKDLEALKMAVSLGLNLKLVDSRGFNLLSLAIEADFVDAVAYLIKTCAMDVNAYNVKHEPNNTRIMTPPVFLAKSPDVVHLLSTNGADMDAQYQKISRTGAVLRSATAMHKAALDSNMVMFGALLERGAHIEVPDNNGLTNEAFYYRSFLNYPSNF